jgi:hypothetical protein
MQTKFGCCLIDGVREEKVKKRNNSKKRVIYQTKVEFETPNKRT